jgi:hypothetical protein
MDNNPPHTVISNPPAGICVIVNILADEKSRANFQM